MHPQSALLVGVALIVGSCALSEAQESSITFDNQSGQTALVKLIGPTPRQVEVPTGGKATVAAAAGRYHIRVRYGTQGNYRYTKGEEFDVTESATTRSRITITLHKVPQGNYETEAITADEFDKAGMPTIEILLKGETEEPSHKTVRTRVAQLTFVNGETLQLSEFAHYPLHKQQFALTPRSGSTPADLYVKQHVTGKPSERKEPLLGYRWRKVGFNRIRSFSLSPNPAVERWAYHPSLICKITLTDGAEICGETPSAADQTWMSGDHFELMGKRKLLGSLGEFSVPLSEVTAVSRYANEPNRFHVQTKSGASYEVEDLQYCICFRGGRTNVSLMFVGNPETSPSPIIVFWVDRTRVELKLVDIDRIDFRGGTKDKVFLKSGETAEGDVGGLGFFYGVTGDGDIYFEIKSRAGIASIKFLD